VWDLATGGELWSAPDNGSQGIAALSPDNRGLAFGDYNSAAINVPGAATGQPGKELRPATDPIAAGFRPPGPLVPSCVASGTVKVWKTDKFQEFLTLKHAAAITRLRFSPDSRRLATANHDKTVRIWDLETGQEVLNPPRGHGGRAIDVDFSP